MAILCYHAIDPAWASPLAITPRAFRRQCSWLARHRQVVDLATAVRVGALDFAPWDLIKILGAAALLPLAWRAFGSRQGLG